MPFSVSAKAHAKIVLHCCKYSHKAVNGVLIGSVSKKDQTVQIQDAIPLFHLSLGLSPMLQVALTQVEIYCGSKGLNIVGYYHANERIDDLVPNETAVAIASRIASNCESKACLLMVDNTKLLGEVTPLKLFTRVESESRWKESSKEQLSTVTVEHVQRCVCRAVRNRLYEGLVDFDNHLDNIHLDWTNPELNNVVDAIRNSESDE